MLRRHQHDENGVSPSAREPKPREHSARLSVLSRVLHSLLGAVVMLTFVFPYVQQNACMQLPSLALTKVNRWGAGLIGLSSAVRRRCIGSRTVMCASSPV